MPAAKKDKSTKPKPRHHYSPEDKQKILTEAQKEGETISSVARKHDMPSSQLFLWKRQLKEGVKAKKLNPKRKKLSTTSHLSSSNPSPLTPHDLQVYIVELERLLGKKTVEIEQLKERLSANEFNTK